MADTAAKKTNRKNKNNTNGYTKELFKKYALNISFWCGVLCFFEIWGYTEFYAPMTQGEKLFLTQSIIYVIPLGFLLISVFIYIKKESKKYFAIPYLYALDAALMVVFISTLVFIILSVHDCFLMILGVVICFIILKCINTRRKQFNSLIGRKKFSAKTVVDFADLCVEDFNVEVFEKKYNLNKSDSNCRKTAIFVDETASDEDLLEREVVAENLANLVEQCNTDRHFVIGLEGAWGSGKSSLLNLVKKKLTQRDRILEREIVVIDDFEIWAYGSEESIVHGFFDSLLNGLNIRINPFFVQVHLQSLINAVVNNSERNNILKNILFPAKTILQIKNEINELIRLTGKKIVVYVDNLDRTDGDKVVFMLKMLANVIDFVGVVYIVSYEKDKIVKAFDSESNVDYEYMKKVIQMQVYLPEINYDIKRRLIQTSLENLFKYYDVGTEVLFNRKGLEEFISVMVHTIPDLREYKRILNSIFTKVLRNVNNSLLFLQDRLLLHYVQMNDIEIYTTLKDNYLFLVLEDTISSNKGYDPFITGFMDENLQKRKEFLKEFFEECEAKGYYKIIQTLFPNAADLLIKGKEKENEVYFSPGEIRICDGKYFDLFFSECQNDLAKVEKRLVEINHQIVLESYDENNLLKEDIEKMKDCFDKMMQEYSNTEKSAIVFQIIRSSRSIKDMYKSEEWFEVLFDYYWNIDKSIKNNLNAREQARILLAELAIFLNLKKSLNDESWIEKWICHLEVLIEINERIRRGILKEFKEDREVRAKLWENINKEVLKASIDEKRYNIYDEKYYHGKNTKALEELFSICNQLDGMLASTNHTNEKKLIDYVLWAIQENHKNIFKFLWDIMYFDILEDHWNFDNNMICKLGISIKFRDENTKKLQIEFPRESSFKSFEVNIETEDEKILAEKYEFFEVYLLSLEKPVDSPERLLKSLLPKDWSPSFDQSVYCFEKDSKIVRDRNQSQKVR